MLDKLDRRWGRFAPTHITLYLIIGQVFVFLSALFQLVDPTQLVLWPALAQRGEPWRLVTFLFLPPPVSSTLSLVFLPFGWWLLFLMGNALENFWGTLRYNLFLIVGVLLTIGAAFIFPMSPAVNWFFYGSIFLAFAWLNPDFELTLFFVLPVKIKWIGLFTVATDVYYCVFGGPALRAIIIASFGNVLLFCGRDILNSIRHRRRSMERQAQRVAEEKNGPEARHTCRICGKTDLTNPEMDFRYCSKCAGDECYCPEHIGNHEHVVEQRDEAKS